MRWRYILRIKNYNPKFFGTVDYQDIVFSTLRPVDDQSGDWQKIQMWQTYEGPKVLDGILHKILNVPHPRDKVRCNA